MTRDLAQLILYNANVVTMDRQRPQARLVAIRDERILAVSGNDELDELRGPNTRLIDCQGKTVVPGFNDSHCHLFASMGRLRDVDCSPSSVSSIAEIKALLRERARETTPGTWIRAKGYNEFYLAEKRHPTRQDLDKAAPNHPVWLDHRSLHACVLNSLALSLAGITRETGDPQGGLIERDLATGEPSGLLFEMDSFIGKRVPPPAHVERKQDMRLVNRLCLSLGITSAQDATSTNDLSRWQILRRFKDRSDLSLRVYMMVGIDAWDDFRRRGLTPGYGDSRLRLGAAKIVLDETAGELHPPQEELNRQVFHAHRAGFQVALHAIEESTVEAAIVALEYALKYAPRADHRHRVEHCSVCPPRLMRRLRDIQAVVVTQPPFLYYSGERYLAEVPPSQLGWLYRIRSFVENDLSPAASSDCPVVPNNPLIGIYAAVTRKAQTGQAILAEEGISPAQALAMYTIAGAYASFEEKVKGSLSAGKLADMVILSGDPTQVPAEEIKEIQVETTILSGKIAWHA
jgi:predicted amidohydrolase YtcJ